MLPDGDQIKNANGNASFQITGTDWLKPGDNKTIRVIIIPAEALEGLNLPGLVGRGFPNSKKPQRDEASQEDSNEEDSNRDNTNENGDGDNDSNSGSEFPFRHRETNKNPQTRRPMYGARRSPWGYETDGPIPYPTQSPPVRKPYPKDRMSPQYPSYQPYPSYPQSSEYPNRGASYPDSSYGSSFPESFVNGYPDSGEDTYESSMPVPESNGEGRFIEIVESSPYESEYQPSIEEVPMGRHGQSSFLDAVRGSMIQNDRYSQSATPLVLASRGNSYEESLALTPLEKLLSQRLRDRPRFPLNPSNEVVALLNDSYDIPGLRIYGWRSLASIPVILIFIDLKLIRL